MKKFLFAIFAAILLCTFNIYASDSEDLSTSKMIKVTTEILEIFKNGDSDKLKKYISGEWLDDNHLKIKKYKINNYSPETYEVLFASGDVCVATIGGKSWAHLLVFKFREEYGQYKVIPMGISKASDDYIDPWWFVKDYICTDNSDK
jgi:hypothetical protein